MGYGKSRLKYDDVVRLTLTTMPRHFRVGIRQRDPDAEDGFRDTEINCNNYEFDGPMTAIGRRRGGVTAESVFYTHTGHSHTVHLIQGLSGAEWSRVKMVDDEWYQMNEDELESTNQGPNPRGLRARLRRR